jgi:hypothetical protein
MRLTNTIYGQNAITERTLPLKERTLGTTGQEAGWASEPVWTQRLEEK